MPVSRAAKRLRPLWVISTHSHCNRHVRFTMCAATRDVRFGPIADITRPISACTDWFGGKIWSGKIKRMSKPLKPQGEEPRSEPEVIPPDHAERGTESVRVYVATPGPLGTILVVLIVGLLSAVLLVLLLGALLVWLPVVVLFVTGAIIVGLLRVHFRGR